MPCHGMTRWITASTRCVPQPRLRLITDHFPAPIYSRRSPLRALSIDGRNLLRVFREALPDELPVDYVLECLHVIGATILIFEIVGVLPHVHAEQWRCSSA